MIGLVLPMQLAINADPPLTLKITAPVGAVPPPVQARETLKADGLGYETVVTGLRVSDGDCLPTLKFVWVAEAAE